MGDVLKKSNQAEKELERRIMKDQLQKDKEAEIEENRRKNVARDHLVQVRATLAQQVEEKQQRRIELKKDNAKYIQMIMDQDERDKQEDKKAAL